MSKLSEKDRERIIQVLESGEELPIDYKHVLFPPEKKEYELVYAGKEREEDILADTMAVPLQPVKTFGKNVNGWTNKLIFGDNLQIMKALMDDSDVQGQVKLIYIDPPFATKQEFRGSQDQKAYQDKIAGVKFIEFLRKRLILMKALLASDAFICVHLDYRKGHYLKVLMDEMFKENNFRNEIVVKRGNEKPSRAI
jgi:site-specific DNA-methyltransferase (adenine-specific)/adenine-specific DNA-methyltransferase